RVTLSSESRLLMVLQWLREYPNFKVLAQMYFVSRFYAQHEICHIIPILFVKLNYIGWPAQYDINSLGVHAVIDCSAHPRLRVHPGSADYYRGDKRRNMEVSQVVCGLQGEIYDIVIGKGHNNDQAMFNISGLRMHIELNDFILLADRGYSHHLIITPAKPEWSELASHDRVIVENVFGEAKQFSATSAVFRQSPELQALVLTVCFEIVAERHRNNEFRISPVINTSF
ncbi:MAG: transposase family protein, partial [Sediminibacterium sp.]|uniref:transposase family protein n=1 Tax=Sediminibacterium sp. TaxID=1917865 RepID=UPI0027261562